MSIKNRSIRLSIHNLSLIHPLPDCEEDKHCFGDEILNETLLSNDNFKCYTNSDSFEAILNSIHDSNTDKSSSSTISWGVGDENETTTVLKYELERMEDVLTGQQPIPHDYDTEEYKKWMNYFPRFCISGVALKNLPKNNNNSEYFEEIIAIHPDEYQNQLINESPTVSRETIKETLIERIYNKLTKTLLYPDKAPQVDVNHKSSQISLNSCFSIDDYLKVSPISSSSSALLPQRHTRLRRGHSTKSLISSQISSAKWLKDDTTNDYTSLPFLGDNHVVKDENNFVFLRKHSSKNSNEPKSILKSRFVLPPIDQFRSISATPRATRCNNKYSLNLLTINGEKLEENERISGENQSPRSRKHEGKRLGGK